MVYRFFALNMIQYWFDYVQNIIFIYISVHLCNPSLSWNERLSWLGNCSSLAPRLIGNMDIHSSLVPPLTTG
jgi:hypothetical protein